MNARSAITTFLGDFRELDFGGPADSTPGDAWPGYEQKLERAREKSGESEAVVCAIANVDGNEAVVVSFDFSFMGGSIGVETGRLLARAAEEALKRHLPLVSLVASGGARLQDGISALSQLQLVAAECAALRAAGVPQIAVLRDPTTGGAWASLAASADVILALPGATVAFGGERVRNGDDGDSEAFTAEGKFESGAIDVIVPEAEMPVVLAEYLAMLRAREGKVEPAPVPMPAGRSDAPAEGWEAVSAARAAERPGAEAYLDDYFDTRVSLSGDRCSGRDPGMLCGIGEREGQRIVFAAQTGTANTPAGFRTVMRMLDLAERFGLPILTLIDTPGAAAGAAAERGGIGTALAELFVAMSQVEVPVTAVVIGEGGSGGALALAKPGSIHLMPDSYFAVIAPELAAAVLYRDRDRAQEVAALLGLTVADLERAGFGQVVKRRA